jgi:hypothetical protein
MEPGTSAAVLGWPEIGCGIRVIGQLRRNGLDLIGGIQKTGGKKFDQVKNSSIP